MDNKITIRAARPEDAGELIKIYAPYVLTTAITFEYEVPTEEEFSGRIRNTLKKFPYIVAELDGKPVGYAYAGTFNARRSAIHNCEASIYVSRDMHGMGIGRLLYDKLEALLKHEGYLNVNAAIAYPEQEDEYLTRNSVEFHTHMGFRPVGIFTRTGYKFGHWYNLMWMEKLIGEHEKQPVVTPFAPEDVKKIETQAEER